MPKASKFDKQLAALTDFIHKTIVNDDDLRPSEVDMAKMAVGVAVQLAKDLHDIGDYVRSKKGREW